MNQTYFHATTMPMMNNEKEKIGGGSIQPISERNELMESGFNKESVFSKGNKDNLYQSNQFGHF